VLARSAIDPPYSRGEDWRSQSVAERPHHKDGETQLVECAASSSALSPP